VRLGIRRLSAERTFYLGDAACVVDPFAGEGVAMGLYGAALLMKAFERSGPSPEKAYEKLWHESFDSALRWNAVMRTFYSLRAFREPILHVLQWKPQGMRWLTDLTRYRRVAALS
jgi:2-polyprenyl-6-methoxyphenol hydroxylase-like FAD-dependent oxidoreductase